MMWNKNIVLSVIMPTLNSEKTIRIALESVKKQDFDKNLIEILVIDGGSTDKTREIAQSYGAEIVENIEKLPEIAKYLGIQKAKWKYAMFLDSDEELINNTSLSRRIDFLENTLWCANIAPTWVLNPKGFPLLSDYINTFWEAFSFFIYDFYGDNYLQSSLEKYSYKKNKVWYVFSFSENDTKPILDGGSHTFDLSFLREHFKNEIENVASMASIFTLCSGKTQSLWILEDDFINHYSTSHISWYLKKIKWRIVNNIFYPKVSGAGFSNREIPFHIKFKKYLFIPYWFSIVFPLITSIGIIIRKKHIFYLIHIYFAFYTAFNITFYMVWKLLKISPPELKTYWK